MTSPDDNRNPEERPADRDPVTPVAKERARLRPSALRDATAGAFDTRTERWQEVGLGGEVSKAESRKALREAFLLVLLGIGVLVAFGFRNELFPGVGKPIRYVTAVLLVAIGWGLARTVAKGIAPALLRRMEPATAGSLGFFIRLMTIVVVTFVSLAIAGVDPETLAVGGAFTAVIIGLAAQQTLGNVIAGAVLLSARPFRVGDRVAVQGSGIDIEGTVASLGLFYTVLVTGGDRILIPNSTLMMIAVMPQHEAEAVELTANFHSDVTPAELQEILEARISVPLARPPRVELEEIGADGLYTFEIVATPERNHDGAQLAGDILAAITSVGGESDTDSEGEPETETRPTAD
ncbi:MAG: mechanosensitive ion channel family protein [Solirubrobacterales bacterium]